MLKILYERHKFWEWVQDKSNRVVSWFANPKAGDYTLDGNTNLIMHLLNIPTEFAGGMGFAIGVFGLALIGKILMIINSFTIEDMKEMTISWVKTLVAPIVEALSKGKGGDK